MGPRKKPTAANKEPTMAARAVRTTPQALATTAAPREKAKSPKLRAGDADAVPVPDAIAVQVGIDDGTGAGLRESDEDFEGIDDGDGFDALERAHDRASRNPTAINTTRAALYQAAVVADERHRSGIKDVALLEIRAALDVYLATYRPGAGDFPVPLRRIPPLPADKGRMVRVPVLRELEAFVRKAQEGISNAKPEEPEVYIETVKRYAAELVVAAGQLGVTPPVSIFADPPDSKVWNALDDDKPVRVIMLEVLVAAGVPRETAVNWLRIFRNGD